MKVGARISAVGVVYMDPEGVCLRVRDRSEIRLLSAGDTGDTGSSGGVGQPAIRPSVPDTDVPTGSALPFTDVKQGDWCYDAVEYVYQRGMMNGTTASTFSPNATTTRGMIVTILYRLEGEPAAKAAGFSDVTADRYCAKAVAWGAANGIVNGFADNTFRPDSTITREQFAAILYRYMQYKGMDAVNLAENLTQFPDADQLSGYAVQPMNWAVGAGLISGKANGLLDSAGGTTRAQAAMILSRLCRNFDL